MPDVFAEFCAAGLWPGLGQAMASKLAEAGIRTPADVTAPNLSGLPRMTDRRANRLVTSFIGAGQLYDIAELLVPQEIPVRWAARLAEARGAWTASGELRAWAAELTPPADVDALARRLVAAGQATFKSGDIEQARELLERVARVPGPRQHEALWRLGTVLDETGDWHEASQCRRARH